MGSINQDDVSASETGSASDFIEPTLNNNGMLNDESEVQNTEFANPLLKDVEVENKPLKDKPKVIDLKLFNNKFNDRLKKMHSKMPTILKEVMWHERFKLLAYTFERVKSGESDVQLDADFGGRPVPLDELFPPLDDNLIKKPPEDFKIHVDCKQFKPNELKVTVKEGSVLLHGSHDSKPDEHGFVKREFTRSWSIPEDVEQEKFRCLLDQYGILTIRAPRQAPKFIPVQTQIAED